MPDVLFNRIQAIRVFAVSVTPIFTNKKHSINTLKMAPLLRSDVSNAVLREQWLLRIGETG
jgi:hypothetical protein